MKFTIDTFFNANKKQFVVHGEDCSAIQGKLAANHKLLYWIIGQDVEDAIRNDLHQYQEKGENCTRNDYEISSCISKEEL